MIKLTSSGYEIIGVVKERYVFALIVCFLFNPASRVAAKEVFPCFVIAENENREGNGRDPPIDLQRIHSQSFVHAWSITQEGSQRCFKEDSEVQHFITHALLEQGVLSCLANDQVSPLYNNNGGKECCVTCKFQDLSFSVGPFLPI